MKRGGETYVVLQARPKGLKCLAVNVGREQEGGTSVEPKSWTRPQVIASGNSITPVADVSAVLPRLFSHNLLFLGIISTVVGCGVVGTWSNIVHSLEAPPSLRIFLEHCNLPLWPLFCEPASDANCEKGLGFRV